MRVNAVVVAAGESRRMGSDLPKPFLLLGGRPVIVHTLTRFASSRARKVILVIQEEERGRFEALLRDPGVGGLEVILQAGGRRRQDSVGRGLERLDPDCEVVVIHDGARPFVSAVLIDRCIEEARKKGAVVVGIPARETIKVVSSDSRVVETPPRDTLWEIQTPQAFQTQIIRAAHELAKREGVEGTDDAMLVERLGREVIVLRGERSNIKITEPEDLIFAEALIRAGKI